MVQATVTSHTLGQLFILQIFGDDPAASGRDRGPGTSRTGVIECCLGVSTRVPRG
jgi:hypothetical protein